MKNLFLAILLGMTTSFCWSQKDPVTAPQMPVDKTTGEVTYEGTVETKGTKAEVYKKALNWFKAHYKNPAEVIREQDSVGGKITGKARFKIFNEDKKGFRTDAGLVMYSITITAMEGKFTYQITKINWKQPSYYGIEKWMDKASKMYLKVYDFYLYQTDQEIASVITALKNAMK